MTKPKKKKTVFTADEIDFIHSEEVKRDYGIGFGEQLELLEKCKLTAYERRPGVFQDIYADMDPDKWEKITGKKIPAGWPYMDSPEYDGPKEGLEVPAERKAEYRRLGSNEIGGLTAEKVKQLYLSRLDIEALESSKTPAANKRQDTTGRTSTTKQIYVAATSRAETVIKDLLHNDILPETRKEKFKALMEDKKFQKITSTLSAKQPQIIRKLGTAGIWKIGNKSNKKSKRESDKKYRKKSLYES